MIVYLASPRNQSQGQALEGMPVLISYALWTPWLDGYQHIFKRILIDSGAFSEFNSGKKVDGEKYKEWQDRWNGRADAVAGLDDISGDWKRSLRNYELYGGFPTIHEEDPPELLKDLIPIARERGSWIGIGLTPPRTGKEKLVRSLCDQIPDDLHVHGWACREYTHIARLDSVDSTNWFRGALTIKEKIPWLTLSECVGVIVKRYQRWKRVIRSEEKGFF